MKPKYEDWQIILRDLNERKASAIRRKDERELEHIEGQLNDFRADPRAYVRGVKQAEAAMEEAAHDY